MNSKMLARNVFPIARTLLRANGAATTRVTAYHNESAPPTSQNDLPVHLRPCQWQADYKIKQKRYNMQIMIGVYIAIFAMGVATSSAMIDFHRELKNE